MSDKETPRTLIEGYLAVVNTQPTTRQTRIRSHLARTPVSNNENISSKDGHGKTSKGKQTGRNRERGRSSIGSDTSLITPRTRVSRHSTCTSVFLSALKLTER